MEENTDGANRKSFVRTIGNTEYTVIVEQSENARETVLKKVKRLIDKDCDKIIFEHKVSMQSAMNKKPLKG